MPNRITLKSKQFANLTRSVYLDTHAIGIDAFKSGEIVDKNGRGDKKDAARTLSSFWMSSYT